MIRRILRSRHSACDSRFCHGNIRREPSFCFWSRNSSRGSMFAGRTRPLPHPPYPLNRVRSLSFVRPGPTSSERRASWRAVRLAECMSMAGWPARWKPYRRSHRNGRRNTRKMPESKDLLPCAKSFEPKILENPNEISFSASRRAFAVSFWDDCGLVAGLRRPPQLPGSHRPFAQARRWPSTSRLAAGHAQLTPLQFARR